jgi:DAK2 domain fusion protein YloV
MGARDHLGAAELRATMAAFRDALRVHQEAINRLNVYPVPDGDTGTNMALTMESVVTELEGADDGMAAVCHAIGHGSLMGARGNSGVITCQILRGMVTEIRDDEQVDGATLAAALAAASKSSYEAVQKPTEGTILTVLREASQAAVEAADAGADLVSVLDAARVEGGESLDRTPELLAVLAEAGVVDAGGAGFLLLLDALLHVTDERPLPEPVDRPAAASVVLSGSASAESVDADGHDVSDLRYEVMYFLEAPDETIPAFKDVWAGLGDSIVVVGGDGIWNCHVHTDDIGAAVEAAIEIGRPRQIRVTDLFEEVEEERWVREAAAAAADDDPPHDPVGCGVVAVATGDGIRRIFHSLRVQKVVTGGQSMNPSTQQLLEAVDAVQADQVVILPNNKNIIAVAEKVDELTEKSVRVVATRSVTEGFAALLAYDPEAEADANHEAMTDMAASVVAAEVTQAVRDSNSDVGPIAEGDFMGIGPSGILAVEATVVDAACELLASLVTSDHEIITVIEGDGASAGDTRKITEWLAEHRPDAEPEVHHGGQPLYPYLFGIE